MSSSSISMIAHGNATRLPPFSMEGLLAMFYLVPPSQSSFEDISLVPNYVTGATSHFFVMIFLEMVILLFKGKELRINDKLTSVMQGMYSELVRLLGLRAIAIALYSYVHNNYYIIVLPWDSVYTWIVMAIAFDFLYYWFHRAAHEINLLWSAHQTHHSSEDYNMSTALRQSVLQPFTSMCFYLPAALFIPPSVFLVHSQFNLLYQFWIHTEMVNNLGPLEYILNTPSHHRVHHGRNRYCIDKNYAATLIIWDRMFGTFEAERKEEKIAYGLVVPVNSFEPNYIQFSYLIYVLKRSWNAKGFKHKIQVLINGAGWTPGKPRLGNNQDIPDIENPIQTYNPTTSYWLNAYVMVHYLLALIIYQQSLAMQIQKPLPFYLCLTFLLFELASLTCFGLIFDNKSHAKGMELFRCVVCAALLYYFHINFDYLLSLPSNTGFAMAVVFQVSAIAWSFHLFKLTNVIKKRQ